MRIMEDLPTRAALLRQRIEERSRSRAFVKRSSVPVPAGDDIALPGIRRKRDASFLAALKEAKLHVASTSMHGVATCHREVQERAMQHVELEAQLRLLNGGLRSLTRRGRDRVQALHGLESRILRLRAENSFAESRSGPGRPWADKAVDSEAKAPATSGSELGRHVVGLFALCPTCGEKCLSAALPHHSAVCTGEQAEENSEAGDEEEEQLNSRASLQLAPCPICTRSYPVAMMPRHETSCKKRAKLRDIDKGNIPAAQAIAAMPPRPPRNFMSASVGPDWIDLRWDPPIIDGGFPIFEYEISYSIHRIIKIDKYTKEDLILPQSPVLTSRWAQKHPVASNGFRLTGLEAGGHYVNISVRCCNEVGWSASSEAIGEIWAAAAGAPSPPIHSHVAHVTSDRIRFEWKCPLQTGGVPVTSYWLSYTPVTATETTARDGGRAGKRRERKDHAHEMELGSCEVFTLRKLRGGALYKDLKLWCVNKAGLASVSVSLPDVTTLPPTRRQLLEDELERTCAASEDFVDTDFYLGYYQRTDRLQHIQDLERDLAAILKAENLDDEEDDGDANTDQMGAAHQETGAASLAAQRAAEEDAIIESLVPDHKRRKEQYQHRIAKLREDVESCTQQRLATVGQRAVISQRLGATQSRLLDVNAEFDRIASFSGGNVQSSILHGASQQFPLPVLRRALRAELARCQRIMTEDKEEAMRATAHASAMKDLKEKKEQYLLDRITAYGAFQTQCSRALRLGAKSRAAVQGGASDAPLLARCLVMLRAHADARRASRSIIGRAAERARLRKLNASFTRWHRGPGPQEDDGVRSSAGRLLAQVETAREEISWEGRLVMSRAATISNSLQLAAYNYRQRQRLRSSEIFDDTELGELLLRSLDEANEMQIDLMGIIQGDGLVASGNVQGGLDCYHMVLQSAAHQDPGKGMSLLALVYGRLGSAYLRLPVVKPEYALLMFDRQYELSDVAAHAPGCAAALFGLAEGSLASARPAEAVVLLQKSLARAVAIADPLAEARAHRLLGKAYLRLDQPEYSSAHRSAAEAIANDLHSRLEGAHATLARCRARLVGQTAEQSKVVELERVSAAMMRLRLQEKQVLTNRAVAVEDLDKQHIMVAKVKRLQQMIKKEMEEAQTTDKDTMSSRLIVEGEVMEFEIEEFKARLQEREEEVQLQVEEEVATERAYTNRVTNFDDELSMIESDMAMERGPLVMSSLKKRRMRTIAQNVSNMLGNEVGGSATGGVEQIIAVEGSSLHIHDLRDGKLVRSFAGDKEGRHAGDLLGHTRIITCVAFYGTRAFSGSMDCTIQVWETEPSNCHRIMVLVGHEATVCCVGASALRIVSGGADKNIMIWSANSGTLLQTLHGHSRSVSCLHLGADRFASGGADGGVRLWKFAGNSQGEECVCVGRSREEGSDGSPVTSVASGNLELVSGHANGKIVVWWAATGVAMVSASPHSGPVRSLQFDATRVVTASVDGTVCVTDITTGEVTMCLRGHETEVCSIAFDTEKILSVSTDGVLRFWEWRKGAGSAVGGASGRVDRWHTMDAGDTLLKVAKRYGASIPELIRWNGIRDARSVGVGTKLIVTKADPDKPTKLEVEFLRVEEAARQRGRTVEALRKTAREQEKALLTSSAARLGSHALEDPGSFACRIARRDKDFYSLWKAAAYVHHVQLIADDSTEFSIAGRMLSRSKAIEREKRALLSGWEATGMTGESEHDEGSEDTATADVVAAVVEDYVAFACVELARLCITQSAPPASLLGRIQASSAPVDGA